MYGGTESTVIQIAYSIVHYTGIVVPLRPSNDSAHWMGEAQVQG